MVVQFPDMRRAVIEALQALSDPEYQRRVWVERTYPQPGFYDDLTHNVNVLYDDTSVAEDPRAQIGVTLESEAEAAAIESLTAVLDPLFAHQTRRRSSDLPARMECRCEGGTGGCRHYSLRTVPPDR
ncbi:SCO4402 family protein [Actinomadura luteofluorescens]